MSGATFKPEDSGEQAHIWLRYATQFSSGGRTYTVEMGIPVPLGASTETREQLILEAEAGMNQLSQHVENKIAQMVQRHQHNATNGQPRAASQGESRPSNPPSKPPVSASVNKPSPSPDHNSARPNTSQTTAHADMPVPLPAEKEAPYTGEREVSVPRTRPNIGATMPLSPGLPGDSNSNILLPQFIQIIKDTWGLRPPEAMKILNVKSLNGLNLRDELKRLQQLMSQDKIEEKPTMPVPSLSSNQPNDAPLRASTNTTNSPTLPPPEGRPPIPIYPIDQSQIRDGRVKEKTIHELHPAIVFEEEEEDIDLDELDLNLDEDEELSRAREKVSRLREEHGSTTASAGRVQVLQNVLNDELPEDDLNALVLYIWNTATPKKLKTDQLEALIKWAKEDDFLTEAEAVLKLAHKE